MKRFFGIFLPLFLIVGCISIPSKKSETISQGVYAVSDSLKAHRVDLAQKYSDETVKLVLEPKNRIKIDSINVNTVDSANGVKIKSKAVILPENMTGPVVRLNTREYFELLQDRDNARAFEKGERAWKKYSGEVENRKKEDAQKINDLTNKLAKEKANKLSVLSMVKYGIMAILSIPILIIGIVAVYLISIMVKVIKRMKSEDVTTQS